MCIVRGIWIKKAVHVFSWALQVLSVVSCCRGDVEPVELPNTQRTLIVYFAGDNNLSAEVNSKISALTEGFANVDAKKNRLAVFADYRDGMPELIEITHEGPVPLETYPSINSADPESMKSIIARIVKMFPAESYGLVCFSHASGWLPTGALSDPVGYAGGTEPFISPSSILQDGDNEMDIADFAGSIRLPDDVKYDFIILEACYMAGVEVAYELKDVACSLVVSASEILSPGFKDSYGKNLYMLFQDDADAVGFAKTYFDYWNSMSGALQSATISVIDLQYVEELASEVAHVIDNGSYLISDPSGIQHFNRSHYHLFFDLTEYLEAVVGNDDSDIMAEYHSVLKKTVVYTNATKSFMTGYPYSFNIRTNCGLTTYIMQPELESLNSDYERTSYCTDVLSHLAEDNRNLL